MKELVEQTEAEKEPVKYPTPWSLHIEESKVKYDSETGARKIPVKNCWVRDADGIAIKLFMVSSPEDERMAQLFTLAPQLLEVLEAVLAEKCPDGETYSFKSKEESDLYVRAEKIVSKARGK